MIDKVFWIMEIGNRKWGATNREPAVENFTNVLFISDKDVERTTFMIKNN